MPGSLYVLIAAMGSSIFVRNRNILIRASVPVAVGVGMGWAVIPLTMRNVSDLVWAYEQRWPVVADSHRRTQDAIVNFVQTGVAHSRMGAAMVEERIGDVRKKVEEWIRQGK